MQISWFEIIAQIINFFIILFILQKLLYKPVMNAMEKRQERIQKSQIEADEKMKEANELIYRYERKIEDIQKEKREILDEARSEATKKKESLLQEYQTEAENKRNAYLKEIEDEKENFIDRLRKNIGESAVRIASHILNEISSKELENEVFDTFILSLRNLKQDIPDEKVLSSEEHAEVLSSRALSAAEKKTVEDSLRDQIKNLKAVGYQTDPDLILGHELSLETYTVHASIRNYLDEIERDIIRGLDTK